MAGDLGAFPRVGIGKSDRQPPPHEPSPAPHGAQLKTRYLLFLFFFFRSRLDFLPTRPSARRLRPSWTVEPVDKHDYIVNRICRTKTKISAQIVRGGETATYPRPTHTTVFQRTHCSGHAFRSVSNRGGPDLCWSASFACFSYVVSDFSFRKFTVYFFTCFSNILQRLPKQ